jgi:hypothetical protein
MIAEAEEIVLFAKADTGHLKKLFVNAHANIRAPVCARALARAHARARTTRAGRFGRHRGRRAPAVAHVRHGSLASPSRSFPRPWESGRPRTGFRCGHSPAARPCRRYLCMATAAATSAARLRPRPARPSICRDMSAAASFAPLGRAVAAGLGGLCAQGGGLGGLCAMGGGLGGLCAQGRGWWGSRAARASR